MDTFDTPSDSLKRPFTLSRFRILVPLYELHEHTVGVPIKAGLAFVHFTIVDSCADPVFKVGATGSASMQVVGDDLGSLHNTLVEVALPGEADMTTMPPIGGIPPGQRSAVNILNAVIEHYRLLASAPQIRPVPYKHVRAFEFVHYHEDGTANAGYFWGPGLSTKGEKANVPKAKMEIVEKVQESALTGPVPLWASLRLDSYAELAGC